MNLKLSLSEGKKFTVLKTNVHYWDQHLYIASKSLLDKEYGPWKIESFHRDNDLETSFKGLGGFHYMNLDELIHEMEKIADLEDWH